MIRREPAGGGSDWAKKWFVLWPRPGGALKEYPAKELKDRGGKWLFQFPCGASGGAPSAETVAESPFPIAGAQIAPLPMTGMDTPMIELTLAVRLITLTHAPSACNRSRIRLTRERCWGAQGDATKIRLAADPESFGLWMSAIDDLANETTRATIDFTRR